MADASFILEPEFQEAHRAHERQQRIFTGKVASALVVFLMPPGIVLDYFVYEKQLVPFLWIRLFGSALAAVLWFLHTTSFGQKHVRWFGLAIPFVPAFCIAWMIYRVGEPASQYYAGLNLILLAVSVVGHWTFIESLIVAAGITLMYFVAATLQPGSLVNWEPAVRAGFVNNLYFLILTSIIMVTGNSYYNRLRFREFCLAFELEKNKQQLEESNRKLTELDQIKGRFFANISHELRTPLTLIISPLETILARFRGALDADTVGLLQTMQSNGLRLLKLINDLLDLVRLDSGVMQVKPEPVALDDFLRGMASAARQIADDKRIKLVVSVAPNLSAVMVDRDKLEKIVLNLQFNALKFTPADGRVELSLDRQGEELVLKVSDTGIGIPKDKLPEMFQRFMQVDTSSRRKYQGVGIGLALVKELVEVQSGKVSVESVEGQGSTFTVRLPYLEAPADAVLPVVRSQLPVNGEEQRTTDNGALTTGATVSSQEWLSDLYHRANLFGSAGVERNAAPARDAALNSHVRTVLIADDQPDMLRFIKSELALHYNIIEATDGQQAVDKAAASTPDIILLDMMMPEKDGIQAAREIRAAPATQNVPIILITAHVDEETKLSALRAGASDFLPKPFSTTELHVRVKNLVESHEFQRQLTERNVKLADTIELLKATETQLVQSEKVASLGRLSAGIIHEINNPLNFATTGLYVLRNQGAHLAKEKPDEFSEVVHDIDEGLQRVKNIVGDLRSFTHPDSNQRDMVKVAEIITSSLRFLSNEWRDKVQMDLAVPADLFCRANKNKLTQVFVNLIQNSLDALKHRPTGAEPPLICVSGRQENDKIIVSVRDNGEGVDAENIAKIFDPFFTTREVGKGMGMGLSICYRIIQEHRGNISVASERGRFCQFTVELPIAEDAAVAN